MLIPCQSALILEERYQVQQLHFKLYFELNKIPAVIYCQREDATMKYIKMQDCNDHISNNHLTLAR